MAHPATMRFRCLWGEGEIILHQPLPDTSRGARDAAMISYGFRVGSCRLTCGAGAFRPMLLQRLILILNSGLSSFGALQIVAASRLVTLRLICANDAMQHQRP
jgi:hypothetical protein